MFEVCLAQGSIMRKVIEAMKDIVSDCNWDCSSSGISIQAMDSSHVCLISVELDSDGFDPFRCDKNLSLGVKLATIVKILKCGTNDDTLTLRCQDSSDTLTLLFESPNQERISQFEMKLMDIDAEHLAIPDTEYNAVVRMPSHQFQRICRDLSQFGDSMVITCTKDGVQFSSTGDIGSGKIELKQNASVDKESEEVAIELTEPVSLTFACRFLNEFTKASPIASSVTLSLKSGQPLVCEYKMENMGHIRYYLAPKIADEDEDHQICDD